MYIFPRLALCVAACGPNPVSKNDHQSDTAAAALPITSSDDVSVATFASGCFWCVEEVFENILGVREVVSGYAGGNAEDANYEDVSSGRTDHAEAVEIYYDTTIIDFQRLTQAFFASHDPTTINQQGPDRGRQYRSIAFYRNEKEKDVILNEIIRLTDEGVFDKPIVTEVVPFTAFYPAESYHQDYVRNHPNDPYIRNISKPRFNRFKEKHPELLKEE